MQQSKILDCQEFWTKTPIKERLCWISQFQGNIDKEVHIVQSKHRSLLFCTDLKLMPSVDWFVSNFKVTNRQTTLFAKFNAYWDNKTNSKQNTHLPWLMWCQVYLCVLLWGQDVRHVANHLSTPGACLRLLWKVSKDKGSKVFPIYLQLACFICVTRVYVVCSLAYISLLYL